jgi:uncharacterized membrane protein
MVLYYAAVGLAVLANLFYHVSQKLTPSGANPALAIAVTYLVGMGLSLMILWMFFPLKTGLGPALRQLNWASVMLGLAVVGIEFGFLLAYRAGGNISLAQIVVSATVTLALIPMGLVFFNEKISWVNGLGIVLCLAGLVLINIKS